MLVLATAGSEDATLDEVSVTNNNGAGVFAVDGAGGSITINERCLMLLSSYQLQAFVFGGTVTKCTTIYSGNFQHPDQNIGS